MRIAIVGGGFSGLAVLTHLVAKANRPFEIHLFEPSSDFGTGWAYGKSQPWHLLNVRASNMGAITSEPKDFSLWLAANESLWRPAFPELAVSPSSYVPRRLYGRYLADLRQRTISQAKAKGIAFQFTQAQVTDVERLAQGFSLHTSSGAFSSDYVVLAVGMPPSKNARFETAELRSDRRYTHSIWDPAPESLFGGPAAAKLGGGDRVVLLGSGLTAVDALTSLHQMQCPAEIVVLSRHGSFPQSHPVSPPESLRQYAPKEYPASCVKLLAQFRSDLTRALQEGHEWRQMIDALRPFTPRLWESLTVRSKKQFMRHLLSRWNKHRHRMPPESALMISSWSPTKLKMVAGQVLDVVADSNTKLKVRYRVGSGGRLEEVQANHVINCFGSEYRLHRRHDSLIQRLLQHGLVVADALDLGLRIQEDQRLAGNNHGRLFALGALLMGERFETIAVPELREQANAIANSILSD